MATQSSNLAKVTSRKLFKYTNDFLSGVSQNNQPCGPEPANVRITEEFSIKPTDNTLHEPKIKIKNLKELQYPKVVNRRTGTSGPDRYFNSQVNNNTLVNKIENFQYNVHQNHYTGTLHSHHSRHKYPHSNTLYCRTEPGVKEKESLLKERLQHIKKTQALLKAVSQREREGIQSENIQMSTSFADNTHQERAHVSVIRYAKQSLNNTNYPTHQTEASCRNSEKKTVQETDNNKPANVSNSVTKNISFQYVGVGESPYLPVRDNLLMDTHHPTPLGGDTERNTSPETDGMEVQLPAIGTTEDIDSTGLRNGIIKGSRTLIKTEKSLKALSHVILRSKVLPPKQASNLVRRFRGILKTFNTTIKDIETNINDEYKNVLSNYTYEKINNKSDDTNVNKICKQINGNAEKLNNKLIGLHKEPKYDDMGHKSSSPKGRQQTNLQYKKTGKRCKKTENEMLDQIFHPVTQTTSCATISRREVPQRSCRKRQQSFVAILESDIESD